MKEKCCYLALIGLFTLISAPIFSQVAYSNRIDSKICYKTAAWSEECAYENSILKRKMRATYELTTEQKVIEVASDSLIRIWVSTSRDSINGSKDPPAPPESGAEIYAKPSGEIRQRNLLGFYAFGSDLDVPIALNYINFTIVFPQEEILPPKWTHIFTGSDGKEIGSITYFLPEVTNESRKLKVDFSFSVNEKKSFILIASGTCIFDKSLGIISRRDMSYYFEMKVKTNCDEMNEKVVNYGRQVSNLVD